VLVGGLNGPESDMEVRSGGQMKWTSTSPLMCALLIFCGRQKGYCGRQKGYCGRQKGYWFQCILRMSWITWQLSQLQWNPW